jgi:transposase
MSKKGKSMGLPIVNVRAAGIDIGSRIQVAAVPPELSDEPVQTFQSFTGDIERMADWLVSVGVTTVAMESTGVYWVPVYEVLEGRGLTVVLANARDCKTVPGRKSDVNDAQWLQRLHACGLLRASFRPTRDIAALRTHMQHMQKALTHMNLQLHHVISDISGVTGLKIIRAILQGERDPDKLAALRDVRCRESVETIRKSLVGNYEPEHIFALAQALKLFESYQERITDCDTQIEQALQLLCADKAEPQEPLGKPRSRTKQSNSPSFDARPLLYQLTGTDLTQIHGLGPSVALSLISECGTDLSRWPTEKHFTSWLTLSPGCKISGGKVLSSHTRKSSNRIAARLRLVATSVGRTETALGAFYRRLAVRIGKAKALTATARKIAILFYRAMRFGLRYEDPGADQYEQRYRERVVRQLQRRAALFGFTLQPSEVSVS